MLFTKIESDRVIGPHVDHIRCKHCHCAGYQLKATVKYLSIDFIHLPLFVVKRDYLFTCQCGHHQKPCVKPKQFKQLVQQMLPWYYLAYRHIGVLLMMLMSLGLMQNLNIDRPQQPLLMPQLHVYDYCANPSTQLVYQWFYHHDGQA